MATSVEDAGRIVEAVRRSGRQLSVGHELRLSAQWAPVKRLVHLARERGKPLMIAESAPQGYDLSDVTFSRDGNSPEPKTAAAIHAEWFAPYFAFIAENLDVLRAAAYINADWDTQRMWAAPYPNGYFGDSRVQANAELLEHWRADTAAPHFN